MTFTSFGGRSSDGYMTFFNLLKPNGGVMLAIGWTGEWTASFRHSGGNSMTITAGMEFTRFTLLPGEEVRTPSILLEFSDGVEPIREHNLFRALVRPGLAASRCKCRSPYRCIARWALKQPPNRKAGRKVDEKLVSNDLTSMPMHIILQIAIV